MSVEIAPLASGSKGNSVYIGSKNTKILVDAGLSGVKIENILKELNITPENLDGILVTHEHSDHIDGVGILSRRYNLNVYATEGTWGNMPSKIGEISSRNKKIIYPNESFTINDFYITPFKVPHDAKEPVCYNIFNNGKKITVATDLGSVTKDVLENIRHCHVLVLESNHDIQMLKNSSYPSLLKERVLGKLGHLSNDLSSKLLACVMNENLKNVFLAHISKENNTHELVYNTTTETLREFGIIAGEHLNLHIAKDYGITEVVKI